MTRRRARGLPFPRTRTTPKSGHWYEHGRGRERLARDRTLVARAYPRLAFSTAGTQVYVTGTLEYGVPCGVIDRVVVKVVLTPDYPSSEPEAYDAESRFPHEADRHLESTGRCCLWLPEETRWDPHGDDGLVAFLDQVTLFFDRQLVYDACGRWVGPERQHGVEGYLDFLVERLGGMEALLALAPLLTTADSPSDDVPCGCGSGRKFRACHRRAVEAIRRGRSAPRLVSALKLAEGRLSIA